MSEPRAIDKSAEHLVNAAGAYVTRPSIERGNGWSLDELINWLRAKGDFTTPLSPDERALCLAVAEAWYFANYLQELPARAHGRDSREFLAFWWGTWKLRIKRGDMPDPVPTSPGTTK